jgi:O-antigen/teichoic acid export membrane protein
VATLAERAATELGFGADDIRALRRAALLHDIGRLGVPISAVFTMTTIGVVTLAYSARLVKMSVVKLFPTTELFKRFLAAALPGAIMWLAYKKFPVTNFGELLASCAIYTLIYAIICYVTKLVTFDDVRSCSAARPRLAG